jgi:ligand-binding SRPBCC domain-containing protein
MTFGARFTGCRWDSSKANVEQLTQRRCFAKNLVNAYSYEMGHVQVSRLIPATTGEVYRYITDLGNLPQWLDPSMEVEFPQGVPMLREQTEFALQFTRFARSIEATFRVDQVRPREKFSYRQVEGFFKAWVHTQLISSHDSKMTLITDVVDFTMPGGVLGSLADDLFVRSDIERLLKHRLIKIEERFLGPA